jgi:hypothetical protein
LGLLHQTTSRQRSLIHFGVDQLGDRGSDFLQFLHKALIGPSRRARKVINNPVTCEQESGMESSFSHLTLPSSGVPSTGDRIANHNLPAQGLQTNWIRTIY